MTQTYEFDKVGNRLTKTEGGNTTNYTYNNVNKMLTAGSDSYTYDQTGNTLSGGGRDYAWDQQNRLKAVTKDGTTVRFTYRTDGLRARKEVVGGLTIDYVYDGQTVVGEKRSDGKSVWYTPGPNGYISRTVVDDATGNVTDKEWFVYDGLGSCRAMVKPNAQGTDALITARMDYDVYGKVRTQTGSTENKFKYVAGVGHPTDEETGLIYMRARYYDPQVGRFVSEDPKQHSINWFQYGNSNPIKYVDRDGHDAWDVGAAIATIIASLILSNTFRGVFIAAMISLILPEVLLLIGATTPFGLAGDPSWGALIGIAGELIAGLKYAWNLAISGYKASMAARGPFWGVVGEIAGFYAGIYATYYVVSTFWDLVDSQ